MHDGIPVVATTIERQRNDSLLEGPAYIDGILYYVDIANSVIHAYGLDDASYCSWQSATTPTAVLNTVEGPAVIDQKGLHFFNTTGRRYPYSGPLSAALTQGRLIRTNDAKGAPDGTLLIGTMEDPPSGPQGCLYKMAVDGRFSETTLLVDHLTISNGIAWRRDEDGFYFVDTPTKRIDRVTYRGSRVERKPAIDLTEQPGVPDGITIDVEGFLYVALWGGSAILRIDTKSRKILNRFLIPAKYVTSCAFGGQGYRSLFVTTATWKAAGDAVVQPSDDLGGSVFEVSPLGPGVPEPRVHVVGEQV